MNKFSMNSCLDKTASAGRTVRRSTAILIAITLLLSFFELGRMDIVTDNEGQRAAPPAEMLRSGDWVIPRLNGVDYLTKPPLLYWAIAGLYTATGAVSEWTARIPTAACGAILTLLVFVIGRRMIPGPGAWWAALALIASPYVLERTRVAELDVPLTLAVFSAIIALRAAWTAPTASRFFLNTLIAGVALGAAVMLKGPVPLLFVWAAWATHGLAASTEVYGYARRALRWGLGGFALEAVMKGSAGALSLAAPSASGIIKALQTPVALTVFAVAVTWFAWRSAGPGRARNLAALLAATAIAAALAAPWAVAVVHAKGWDYIRALLDEQVFERVSVASRINSGTPFYYLTMLPFMLFPFGLLLPLHLSGSAWREQGAAYRFCVGTGWISVTLFSFIAGKEYEYILPAVPFLLLAAGARLADSPGETAARWLEYWRKGTHITAALLALAALAYATVKGGPAARLIETGALAAAVATLGWRERRNTRKLAPAGVAFALALLAAMLSFRNFHYTGALSPREIAQTAGNLKRAGYRVETGHFTLFHIYPAFAFYAGIEFDAEVNPTAIRAKLLGDEPYFYVLREKYFDQLARTDPRIPPMRLMGPYTRKELTLIGNRPLPIQLPSSDP